MIRNITSTIPKRFGGRTRLILKRINLIHEAVNIKQDIITTNYNIEYPSIIENLKQNNEIPNEIEHLNIYDYYSGNKLYSKSPSLISKIITKFQTPTFIIDGLKEKIDKKNNCVRYYRIEGNDELYVKYRKYDSNFKNVIFEDEFSVFTNKRVRRLEYDENGRKHRMILFNPNNGYKLLERLYDRYSNLFCERRFFKNNKVKGIIIYKDGKVVQTFKGEKEFFTDYFSHIFKNGDIVFNDARLLDRANFAQTKKTKNIIVYHSTERKLDGELKASYTTTINNENKIKKYITSTEMQKESLVKNYNIPVDKINVISSYIEPVEQMSYLNNKDIVYVGRLDENKQIEDIIEAFNLIIDRISSDFTLKIYGEGPELQNLKKLVKKLKLNKRIKFMGFANNLHTVYSNAKLSVLTSKFEGFALSVMESINYGCPVIAYDIEYGPREIITEGKTGILVKNNNVSMLAESMLKVINDDIIFDEVKTKEKFSKESIKDNFVDLIREVGGFENN